MHTCTNHKSKTDFLREIAMQFPVFFGKKNKANRYLRNGTLIKSKADLS